jgi:hypothetical protein
MPFFWAKEGKVSVDLKTALVNEDENPLWGRFHINYVPTMIAFEDGKILSRRDAKPHIGLAEADLESILAEISGSSVTR